MGPQASEKCLPLRYLCLLSPSWTDKRRERGGPGARKEGHDIYLTDGQGEAGWKDRLTRKHLACLTPLQMHQIWGEVNREGTQTEWENDSSWIKGEKRLKSKLNWHLFLMFFQENSFIQILLFSPPFFPLSHFHRLEKCIDFWKVVWERNAIKMKFERDEKSIWKTNVRNWIPNPWQLPAHKEFPRGN